MGHHCPIAVCGWGHEAVLVERKVSAPHHSSHTQELPTAAPAQLGIPAPPWAFIKGSILMTF